MKINSVNWQIARRASLSTQSYARAASLDAFLNHSKLHARAANNAPADMRELFEAAHTEAAQDQ